jgi:hypothetical protein
LILAKNFIPRKIMPLFDTYIMTDWSGGSRRRKNRRDPIWIAYGGIEDVSPQTESPPSRSEAVQLIRSLLLERITVRSRVLVCFDFAYGYPVDFAAAPEAATGKSDLPWRLHSFSQEARRMLGLLKSTLLSLV